MEASAVLLLIISLLTCAGMITAIMVKPKVRFGRVFVNTYWVVTLVGAVVLLCIGLLNPRTFITGLTADSAINPIKILVLFFAMSFLSLFLDEISFFRYIAQKTVQVAGTSQIKLFLALYAVISVLTLFTSNDVIILTFTPFICYFAKYAGINPIPYVLAEFVAANTWSMALVIGNPTNIYLASMYSVGFMEYASVMVLPACAAAVVSFLILFLLFRKTLSVPLRPLSATESAVLLSDKPALIAGILHLAVCTVLLAVSSCIGIDMWVVSFAAAASLVVFMLVLSFVRKRRPTELFSAAKRVPWQFVPFVISMFAIVLALSENGMTEALAGLLSVGDSVFMYGAASFVSANLINNIPMSVLFAFVLQSVPAGSLFPALYATVAGSNLCAVLTPVGALAGIMWVSILKESGVDFSFGAFVKYGLCIAIPALAAALWVIRIMVI